MTDRKTIAAFAWQIIVVVDSLSGLCVFLDVYCHSRKFVGFITFKNGNWHSTVLSLNLFSSVVTSARGLCKCVIVI